MHDEYITAVPAYVSDEAGADYRGLIPLIGADMADLPVACAGLTLVKGHFTTWHEMHWSNFGVDPISNLEPVNGPRDKSKQLYERWMQWVSDALLDVRERDREATIDDLERVVRWGGVMPFRITDTTCRICVQVGYVVPVIAPMCWPTTEIPGDTRRPWDYAFPAEHLRVEVATSHDMGWEDINSTTHARWQKLKESGWEPYSADEWEDGDRPWENWSLSDLYENGYDDFVEQIEENAREEVGEICLHRHADITHIPTRVLHEWIRVVDLQTRAYITRTYTTARQISFAVEEALSTWRGATDR